MERERRRHYRVAMRQLEETPAQGMYVTKTEAKKFALCIGGMFLAMFALILATRK